MMITEHKDLNGNVIYKDRQSMGQTWDDLLPADMATASFDSANRGSDIGGQSLEYDANGNLRRKGDSIYVWDQRGRLMAANVPGYEITYEYNADETLRKRRAVDTGDQSVKAAVLSYLGYRVRYEQISDSASGATYYITHTYGAGGVAASKISDTAGYRYQYYMTDAQGSVIAVTDGSGQVLERFRYSPYGQMERETVAGTAHMNFGYTGVWRDPITGLLHFLYRVYDPELGAFMQEDPIGLAAGDVNFYRYVGNNPATYVDPLGLFNAGMIVKGIFKVGGGIFAIAGAAGTEVFSGGIGTPLAVVLAISGGAGIASGVTDIALGIIQDDEVNYPSPGVASMCTLAATGDTLAASQAQLVEDTALFITPLMSTKAVLSPSTWVTAGQGITTPLIFYNDFESLNEEYNEVLY